MGICIGKHNRGAEPVVGIFGCESKLPRPRSSSQNLQTYGSWCVLFIPVKVRTDSCLKCAVSRDEWGLE